MIVTVFSGDWLDVEVTAVEDDEEVGDVEMTAVEDVCVDGLSVMVVWAVSVNVGVIVTVIRDPTDVDELATGGTSPPRALPTVASSQQPI